MLRKREDNTYEYVPGVGNNVRAIVAPWSCDGVNRWEGLGAQIIGVGIGLTTGIFLGPKIMKHAKKHNPEVYAAIDSQAGYNIA